MAVMRFAAGDFVRDRLERGQDAAGLHGSLRSSACCLRALAPNADAPPLLGFALCGIGISNMVPIAFSAAGNIPGLQPRHRHLGRYHHGAIPACWSAAVGDRLSLPKARGFRRQGLAWRCRSPVALVGAPHLSPAGALRRRHPQLALIWSLSAAIAALLPEQSDAGAVDNDRLRDPPERHSFPRLTGEFSMSSASDFDPKPRRSRPWPSMSAALSSAAARPSSCSR